MELHIHIYYTYIYIHIHTDRQTDTNSDLEIIGVLMKGIQSNSMTIITHEFSSANHFSYFSSLSDDYPR